MKRNESSAIVYLLGALGVGAAVLLFLAACSAPPTTPAPTQAQFALPSTCDIVPDLLYQGQPVYFGDCVPVPATEPPPVDTDTPAPPTDTDTPEPPTATPTPTALPPTATSITALPPTPTSGAAVAPFVGAPLCSDHGAEHNTARFHTVWDSAQGCHYDHEHGQNAFVPAVAAAFSSLGDIQALLGGVQIGSTNPSSQFENVVAALGGKHEGMKWNVYVPVAHPGALGFEDAEVGVVAAAIQYHGFGNYAIEFESRVHSSAFFIKQGMGNSTDYGYIFVLQHQEYGQRVTPYQGTLLPYPDTFQPTYDTPRGPYLTIDCVGAGTGCRPNLAFFMTQTSPPRNAASKWSSKPTGGPSGGPRPETSPFARLLWDVRDTYQVVQWASIGDGYPFIFPWLCSSDGGATYNPVACRYNNSTTTVHEIAGTVPAAWDNLAGWDSNTRVGRITAQGFIGRFGMPVATGSCSVPGLGCFPIKLVNAYVGNWGADLCLVKCSILTPANSPERDIYFCGTRVCAETDAGAQASGWIGPNN